MIAYAGIDTPPYQSGRFTASHCSISKRGNEYLRRISFEVILSLLRNKPVDDPVYIFVKKKQGKGKTSKQALLAGLNKFLRIYYAKVNEVYKLLDDVMKVA